MSQIHLYPLRIEPVFHYRLWGGRRLANLLFTPLSVQVHPSDRQTRYITVVETGKTEAWVMHRRDDLGTPDRFDVYYGMADDQLGVARLDLPEHLIPRAVADRRKHGVTRPISNSKP